MVLQLHHRYRIPFKSYNNKKIQKELIPNIFLKTFKNSYKLQREWHTSQQELLMLLPLRSAKYINPCRLC